MFKELIVPIAMFTVLAFVGIIGIMSIGFSMGIDATQRKAVENGAAHWTINVETGAKTLEWKTK